MRERERRGGGTQWERAGGGARERERDSEGEGEGAQPACHEPRLCCRTTATPRSARVCVPRPLRAVPALRGCAVLLGSQGCDAAVTGPTLSERWPSKQSGVQPDRRRLRRCPERSAANEKQRIRAKRARRFGARFGPRRLGTSRFGPRRLPHRPSPRTLKALWRRFHPSGVRLGACGARAVATSKAAGARAPRAEPKGGRRISEPIPAEEVSKRKV